MAEKKMQRAVILRQEEIADQIYSMVLSAGEAAQKALPGQFVLLYSNDSGRMLPRPISICEADPAPGTLRLVYRVAGQGTAEFAGLKAGDCLDLIAPLGNGFPLARCPKGKKAFLIGGGIGIPPLLQLAKELKGEAQIIAGYRSECFLTKELEANGSLYISTEDGSRGTKGTVLDCILENALSADVIYACGPKPMLRAVKAYAQENKTECWLSLEERMACGIGACLSCVCETTKTDAHSGVKNARICKDGPVFSAEDVCL